MTLPLRGDIRPIAAPARHIPFDLDLPMRPWEKDAACAETDPEAFFPDVGESTKYAKAICQSCPVRQECLDDALADPHEQWGIRGGKTRLELRAMRSRNKGPQVCVICEVPVTGRNIRYCSDEHRAIGKERSNASRKKAS